MTNPAITNVQSNLTSLITSIKVGLDSVTNGAIAALEKCSELQEVNESLTRENERLRLELEGRTEELGKIRILVDALCGNISSPDTMYKEREALEKFSNSPLALYRIGYTNGLDDGYRTGVECHEEIVEALEFYADPDTYYAISFDADSPSGEFADDFSEVDFNLGYNRPMPGKRAREALGV